MTEASIRNSRTGSIVPSAKLGPASCDNPSNSTKSSATAQPKPMVSTKKACQLRGSCCAPARPARNGATTNASGMPSGRMTRNSSPMAIVASAWREATEYSGGTITTRRRVRVLNSLPPEKWCRGPGSNRRLPDLQSGALPPELPRLERGTTGGSKTVRQQSAPVPSALCGSRRGGAHA